MRYQPLPIIFLVGKKYAKQPIFTSKIVQTEQFGGNYLKMLVAFFITFLR